MACFPRFPRSVFRLANLFEHANSRVGRIGLVQRVQGEGYAQASAVDAIRWAVEGHSTRKGGPGGLGLRFLRNFVKATAGVFRIYANKGCYGECNGKNHQHELTGTFPGTLVEMRLNVHEGKRYKLDSE